jgi:hypothetical protein
MHRDSDSLVNKVRVHGACNCRGNTDHASHQRPTFRVSSSEGEGKTSSSCHGLSTIQLVVLVLYLIRSFHSSETLILLPKLHFLPRTRKYWRVGRNFQCSQRCRNSTRRYEKLFSKGSDEFHTSALTFFYFSTQTIKSLLW